MEWLTTLALTVCFGNRKLAVMLISCVPLIELKGAIPIGTEYFGLPLSTSFWLAFAGSSILCIPLMLILKPLYKLARRKSNKTIARIEKFFSGKAKAIDHRQSTFKKMIGIFIFAAIPIPLTGVYTASIIAILINLSFLPAIFAITFGNLVSGGLIMLLTALLGEYVDIFLYILFAFALVLLVLFVYKVLIRKTKEKEFTNEQE